MSIPYKSDHSQNTQLSPNNSPKHAKVQQRNGVLDLFTPLSPRRRKRHSNIGVPSLEGVASINGSVLSGNNVGIDDMRSFPENGGERDWQ